MTTAAHVGRLIRDGAGDFYVRQKAIDILLERGVPAKDYLGEIDALFRWVQRHVRYTKDPFRIEVLHSARRMLELKAGDCDDMTIVLGALIKSVGHPVRIVLTGPDPLRPDLFSHIYLEARHHDQWIPLDATMPYGMGWSPRTPVRQVLSIEEEPSDVRTATATASATHPPPPPPPAPAPLPTPMPMPAPALGRGWLRGLLQGIREEGVQPTRSRASRRCGRCSAGASCSRAVHGRRHACDHLAERPQREAAAANGRTLAGVAQEPGAADRQRAAAATVVDRSRAEPRWRAHRCGALRPVAVRRVATLRPVGRPQPVRPMIAATPGPLGAAVRSAATLYQQFTRMPARSIERVAHARLMPPVVLELGRLAGLVYRSSKWVGRPRTYIHFMDDPPRLVSDVTGRRLFIVGGSYRVTPRGIEG